MEGYFITLSARDFFDYMFLLTIHIIISPGVFFLIRYSKDAIGVSSAA